MTNFKQETMHLIGDHKVDEYYLKYIRDWSVLENPVYSGKGNIDWDVISVVANIDYNEVYGLRCWNGWITFTDTEDWLERDSYGGMEWWAWKRKPSLEKEGIENK